MTVIRIEETAVGPLTGGGEENEHYYGAVRTGSVEEICGDEEHDDEGRTGGCRDEEEREPTP